MWGSPPKASIYHPASPGGLRGGASAPACHSLQMASLTFFCFFLFACFSFWCFETVLHVLFLARTRLSISLGAINVICFEAQPAGPLLF